MTPLEVHLPLWRIRTNGSTLTTIRGRGDNRAADDLTADPRTLAPTQCGADAQQLQINNDPERRLAEQHSFNEALQSIDNACHIGGLLGGLAMGWLPARPLDSEARENLVPQLTAALLGYIDERRIGLDLLADARRDDDKDKLEWATNVLWKTDAQAQQVRALVRKLY